MRRRTSGSLVGLAVFPLFVGAFLSGCALFQRQPPPAPRYLLGPSYEVGGIWFYPQEHFNLTQTGLATVTTNTRPRLTANGEAYDAGALAAGHQTLQLPAIARVTNLDNGLAVVVRINDRGPVRPHRLLELTPRAAHLLGIPPQGNTQIRLDVLDAESHTAIEGLPGAPTLAMTAAPREAVRVEGASAPRAANAPAAQPPAYQPERLPETVIHTSLGPGSLFIRLGSFSRNSFAEQQRHRLAHLSPFVETERRGRQTTYRLRIGPLATVRAADDMLDQVIRAGITDARIVVE